MLSTLRKKMVLSADESKTLYSLLRAEERPLDQIISDFNSSFPHSLPRFIACFSLSTVLQATPNFNFNFNFNFGVLLSLSLSFSPISILGFSIPLAGQEDAQLCSTFGCIRHSSSHLFSPEIFC